MLCDVVQPRLQQLHLQQSRSVVLLGVLQAGEAVRSVRSGMWVGMGQRYAAGQERRTARLAANEQYSG